MVTHSFILELTRDEALRLGIVRCFCGHPPNNHFEHGDQPCAHCKCKALDERVIVGRVLQSV